MNILGISAFYHDAAAVLLRDSEIIAAAQEERFTRIKHDERLPINAINYCLAEAQLHGNDLDSVIFYDKPVTKFTRILETNISIAPKGLHRFRLAFPEQRQKLLIPLEIEKAFEQAGISPPKKMYFCHHHESHAASAFFPSPFESAAVLTIDGVGEWATSTLCHGKNNQLTFLREMRFPHSLGLLYSAFTYFTGFRVNSGEYKLMGLAPYGDPVYADRIRDTLIDLRDDGSFRMNLDYFDYLGGRRMTNAKFADLFDGPPRQPEAEITKRDMDIARSIQVVTEEIVMKMATHARDLTGENRLCLAGGVALNCVANGRLLRECGFDDIWIQPAAGDAGGALGAALVAWHTIENQPRHADKVHDQMQGSYLGPAFSDDEIGAYLQAKHYPATKMPAADRGVIIAKLIADQKVVGHFNGRMEFGPRALGNRSILGDARSPDMQSIMNLKIKHRESFRPFAPSCLAERVNDFFELSSPSPYMLLVAPVKSERCIPRDESAPPQSMNEWVNTARSDLPAITHVDYSARVQTVTHDANPDYYNIIKALEDISGHGILINTSFNVRDEPIVCTPEDAYACFMRTEMDILVLGSYLLTKPEQPAWIDTENLHNQSGLD